MKRVTKRLSRDPAIQWRARTGGNKSVSAFKASAAAFAAWEAQSRGGKRGTVQQCRAEQRALSRDRIASATPPARHQGSAQQRAHAAVLGPRLQSSPTCRSYMRPGHPTHPHIMSSLAHKLPPAGCPVTNSAHFNPASAFNSPPQPTWHTSHVT